MKIGKYTTQGSSKLVETKIEQKKLHNSVFEDFVIQHQLRKYQALY
jgi:hypothetical protein